MRQRRYAVGRHEQCSQIVDLAVRNAIALLQAVDGLLAPVGQRIHCRLRGVIGQRAKALHGVEKGDVEAHDAEADDADSFDLRFHVNVAGAIGLDRKYHRRWGNTM